MIARAAPCVDIRRDRRYSRPMARKSKPDSSADVIARVIHHLRDAYPNPRYELEWSTPVQMLVATILAAQCTDERVNKVTKTLFVEYPDARAFADADLEALEQAVKPTGFFRQKARTVKDVCAVLCERFGGQVPDTMAELVTLPGVARKTANVVLASCFDRSEGVIVDTHVARVSQRLGLTGETKGERIERALMDAVPRDEWNFFGLAMVLFGRYTCTAKKPRCATCSMNGFCPRIGVAS